MKLFKNRYTWFFILILIFAIFTRARFQFTDSIWNDEGINMWNGYAITQGEIFDQEILSEGLAPKILIAFFTLFTGSFNAVRLMSLTFSLLGIIFIFLLGKEVKDELTGLIAAILLTTHHLYWYIGAKGILDVPISAMFIITAYAFLKMEHSNEKLWSIATGLLIIISMFTKRPGVLLLISIIIYFVITRKKLIFKDKKVRYCLGIPIGFLVIGDIIFYALFRSSMLKGLAVYLGSIRGIVDQPFNFTSILFTFILNPWVIVFLVIGILFILFYRKKEQIFLLLWFVIFLAFFEINVAGQTIPRYLVPLVPAALLIAGFALSEINDLVKAFTKKKIVWLIVIIAILISIPFYKEGVALHESKSYTYSGYQEAASWILRNAEENAILFAGSPRTMRGLTRWQYYIGGPGGTEDGRLYYLRGPKYLDNRTAFEKDVELNAESGIPIYLEIDMWEYTQPSWYYPLSQDSIDYFISQGFEPVYVVQRELPTQQGIEKAPVILILKHSGIIEKTDTFNNTEYSNPFEDVPEHSNSSL
ncbi:glycosyltransferase family 39 protein [Candidatus Woesearchaeota archaeon]|nr:glycosyltransferase family 39 protein [Candidatus Woesearchaeota archaeon]MBW3022167.1 glycosyltransferase family 39 protein [Candidatus Woesearchaeota archaeon]